ncbi:hypothetical protein FZEAL_6945 [Fusarium zealandicum]|uniref:Uncharacterized protein n=1 Tax=Fusarium zealandicum TaxID=1053134 RepID=A0A8H4UHK9_9HYPO|nr:hypothetical protein FZEAL_6945 [Fusarium zealandicum]
MVGSQNDGDMADSDHEALSGAVIDGVRKNLHRYFPYKPNLVVINADTNDDRKNEIGSIEVNKTGERMSAMLGDI